MQLSVRARPCFPAAAIVTIEGGGQKQMSDLSIGDRVAVGGGKFSEVIMFSERTVNDRFEFVELHAGSNVLRATSGHHIYASGRYVPTGEVKVGDTLELADGTLRAVTAVKAVMDEGLYNPVTVHGDILVNGVRAATFTPAIQHNIAEAAVSPLRATFERLGLTCTVFESRADFVSVSMTSGTVMG